MNVLLFSTTGDNKSLQLRRFVKTLITDQRMEIVQTFEGLTEKLRSPRIDSLLIVILAAKHQELNDLLGISELLQDTTLFLILPDRKPKTISMGHRLQPRYITYADSDYSMSAAVLNNMLNNTSYNSAI